jgi:hypothetical protein
VPGVGDLWATVRAHGGSHERGVCPATDRWRAGPLERRPGAGARAGALALGPRVLREQVQGAALRIDEDLTQTARRHVDRSLPCAVGLRRDVHPSLMNGFLIPS